MKTIVAIGGGEIKTFETLAIDQKVVELTNKKHPRALFIPTASGDARGYFESFKLVYGEKLGCQTDALFLLDENLDRSIIKEKIKWADLVYVGGGNTLKMMKVWRKMGVDKLLTSAYEEGTVLSGLSAGGICWFDFGHSDSPKFFAEGSGKNFMRVRGLGLVKGTFCPHYVHEKREKDFAALIQKKGGVGYGVDNGASLIFQDGAMSVFRSIDGAVVDKLRKAEITKL